MTLPPLQPQPKGIRFGDRLFTEPALFSLAFIVPSQGIYAVLVIDEQCASRPFRVLYFGESANLKQRVAAQHEKYDEWAREAAGKALYVAYHPTLGMTEQQRKDAESELITRYNTPCNVQMNSFWSLLASQYSKR